MASLSAPVPAPGESVSSFRAASARPDGSMAPALGPTDARTIPPRSRLDIEGPMGQLLPSTRNAAGQALDDRLLILDLDTFSGSERFMQGANLGAAFATGMRAYLDANYGAALTEFKRALIAAYVDGDDLAQIWERERAIIHLYLGNC